MTKKRKPAGYWDVKENCIESALPYETSTQWQKNRGAAYTAATRNGWLDECRAHMTSRECKLRTHDEYVAHAAKERPNGKVVGRYVNSGTPIHHQCECGEIYLIAPSSFTSNKQPCGKCAALKRAQRSAKSGRLGPSDNDAIYCWRVVDDGGRFPKALSGYHLVKFGMTSWRLNDERIKHTAAHNKMEFETLLLNPTNSGEAVRYEAWMQSLGEPVIMPKGTDGFKEFRFVSDTELRLIFDLLPNGQRIRVAKREPGAPLSVPMTAAQAKEDFFATF
jgi:hypothetical protein